MDVSLSLGKESLIPSKKSPGTLFFSLGEENKIFLDYIEDNQEKRASFFLSGDNFLRKNKNETTTGSLTFGDNFTISSTGISSPNTFDININGKVIATYGTDGIIAKNMFRLQDVNGNRSYISNDPNIIYLNPSAHWKYSIVLEDVNHEKINLYTYQHNLKFQISDLLEPVNASDAVTKNYVDQNFQTLNNKIYFKGTNSFSDDKFLIQAVFDDDVINPPVQLTVHMMANSTIIDSFDLTASGNYQYIITLSDYGINDSSDFDIQLQLDSISIDYVAEKIKTEYGCIFHIHYLPEGVNFPPVSSIFLSDTGNVEIKNSLTVTNNMFNNSVEINSMEILFKDKQSKVLSSITSYSENEIIFRLGDGTSAIFSKEFFDNSLITKQILDDQTILKTGGTMTGPLILSRNPIENLEAATKQYSNETIIFKSLGGSGTPILSDNFGVWTHEIDISVNSLNLPYPSYAIAIVTSVKVENQTSVKSAYGILQKDVGTSLMRGTVKILKETLPTDASITHVFGKLFIFSHLS